MGVHRSGRGRVALRTTQHRSESWTLYTHCVLPYTQICWHQRCLRRSLRASWLCYKRPTSPASIAPRWYVYVSSEVKGYYFTMYVMMRVLALVQAIPCRCKGDVPPSANTDAVQCQSRIRRSCERTQYHCAVLGVVLMISNFAGVLLPESLFELSTGYGGSLHRPLLDRTEHAVAHVTKTTAFIMFIFSKADRYAFRGA